MDVHALATQLTAKLSKLGDCRRHKLPILMFPDNSYLLVVMAMEKLYEFFGSNISSTYVICAQMKRVAS